MQKTVFQRELNRYLRTGKVSAAEMARQIGVTPQHINAVARGDRHLGPEKMARLSSWLVDECRLTAHLEGFLGASGATHFHPEQVEDHDCLKDEIYEARNALGDADRALKDGDRPKAKRLAKKARREVDEAIADIKTPHT